MPTEAVIQTGKRSVVIVAQGDGKFAPVDVEIGIEANGQTEIRKGLRGGPEGRGLGPVPDRFGSEPQGDDDAHGRAHSRRCRRATGSTHQGHGKVETIDKGEVMLSHGPIAVAAMAADDDGLQAAGRRHCRKDIAGRRHGQLRVRGSRARAVAFESIAISRASEDDRRPHPLVDRQPLPGAARDAAGRRRGACGRCSRTPLDALPDLSDVQVIIRTTYPGQAPQIVENQVTYPLDHHDAVGAGREDRARLLVLRRFVRLRPVRGRHRSVLGALARARVPEPGAVAPARAGARPRSAPMRPASAGSTSTRWSIAAASMDLSQLRALQDWFLKYELKTRAERRRGGERRRHGAPVPGRARSRPAARVRHPARAR